ncbi:PQQ-dependent sugar dehydrogenase [Pollutibacter soli]|uniref:PQQ-dependent sugar dehydrogenase n=1 Tax=Pollutibacter soli TaxID=3034157 RepID=UPI003013FB9F
MRLLVLSLLIALFSVHEIRGQGEPFSFTEINLKPANPNKYRLAHPFEIIYGPDDHLYITEKVGRVVRVNPVTGLRQIILDHRASTFITSHSSFSISQDGMMGMALHPAFGTGTSQDFIYIAYTYSAGNARISRFNYTGGASPVLNNETVLIQGIPANNDHSSGRLIFGADSLLYYSCGDLGANQFGNRCAEIRSQKLPSAANISSANYSRYSGKILRINRDGSIPSTNPYFAGVQSHIFTIGHRNSQGLVTQKAPTDGTQYPVPYPGGKIFNSEHGPRTDDEINEIIGGRNYGWPYIAGYLDNINYSYIIWATSANCASTGYTENAIPSGAMIRQESDSVLTNFQPPMSTLYTVCNPLPLSKCNASGTDWMKYATIAPASIDYYANSNGLAIPDWYPSLLVPTLRRGVLYRYKMNATSSGFDSDSIPYFRTANRYRDIAISRDGLRIYIITDSVGTTSGPSGTGTTSLANPGAILEFMYTGTLLPVDENKPGAKPVKKDGLRVFPNPASNFIQVQFADQLFSRHTRYILFDMSGRKIMEGTNTAKDFKINTRNIKSGVYLLKIHDGRGLEVASEKIMIQQ